MLYSPMISTVRENQSIEFASGIPKTIKLNGSIDLSCKVDRIESFFLSYQVFMEIWYSSSVQVGIGSRHSGHSIAFRLT